MNPLDETRREEEKRNLDEEREGGSKDSMQASGERSASGWGRVVLRSGDVLVGCLQDGWGRDLPRLSGSGKPVYLMPLNSWSGTSWMAEAIVTEVVVFVVWCYMWSL